MSSLHFGSRDQLNFEMPFDPSSVVRGVAQLIRRDIHMWDLDRSDIGVDVKGKTRICVRKSTTADTWPMPESDPIPGQTDIWVLGYFLLKQHTKKVMPKKCLSNQTLLDSYLESVQASYLGKYLKVQPSERFLDEKDYDDSPDGCSIQ